ncbi:MULTISPECIES: LapA family protein [unclassified Streptomyces]|uniref:LapA family protein n=1 Tax=Streptomyces TaxID=1883 RepID=UPI000DC796C0|nr:MULTISPECIES: LapA family protein [unclassified Streptomyces]AWZ08715.1 DUF1049 domain-containing protein [Streptomyces sp. ICC4]AWZ15828.1 DUF1049 domain-containing protein [Streptomyces sp. ICC1]
MTTPHASKGRSKGRGPITPGRAGIAVIAVLTLVFIFENTRSTKIRLLIPQVTMPLYVALLIAAVLGGLCGAYLARRRR